MMNTHQHLDEVLSNDPQISESNITLLELAVVSQPPDYHVNHVSKFHRSRFVNCSRGRFYGISDHDDCSFSRARLGSWISKFLFERGRVVIVFSASLVIKELHQTGAVMLWNDIDDPWRKL